MEIAAQTVRGTNIAIAVTFMSGPKSHYRKRNQDAQTRTKKLGVRRIRKWSEIGIHGLQDDSYRKTIQSRPKEIYRSPTRKTSAMKSSETDSLLPWNLA